MYYSLCNPPIVNSGLQIYRRRLLEKLDSLMPLPIVEKSQPLRMHTLLG